jgi:tetratricopeptide (TPR) repeat protein
VAEPRHFHRSRECFARAIRLDPNYAEAYFGLALYHGIGAAMGLLHPVEAWRQFEVALATARRLDETLGENLQRPRRDAVVSAPQLGEARERAFEQALAIDPDDARNAKSLRLLAGPILSLR